MMAAANEISDATQAVTLKTPSRMNSRTRGIAATSELHAREWATGSRTCWYTSDLDVRICGLHHSGTQISALETPLRQQLLRVGDRLAVEVAKRGQKERDEAEQQHRQ